MADLAGVEGAELETIAAKLALRPPERRRLETIIADADGYEDFFKQKTAYEILRRDWSSDVCSSD
eukprot:COSAG01_NODE_71116_length_257_cov_0.329114_1_plen_64_part_01